MTHRIDRLWESPEQGITPYVQRDLSSTNPLWRWSGEDTKRTERKGGWLVFFNTQKALEPQLSFSHLMSSAKYKPLIHNRHEGGLFLRGKAVIINQKI